MMVYCPSSPRENVAWRRDTSGCGRGNAASGSLPMVTALPPLAAPAAPPDSGARDGGCSENGVSVSEEPESAALNSRMPMVMTSPSAMVCRCTGTPFARRPNVLSRSVMMQAEGTRVTEACRREIPIPESATVQEGSRPIVTMLPSSGNEMISLMSRFLAHRSRPARCGRLPAAHGKGRR